jgi:hypothetical protein
MCRQRIDPEEWDECGGAALGDRAEWSDRACGMAALRMILLAYLADAPPLTELVMTGVREGALTGRGWLHAGIARLAAGFGIPAAAEAAAADELPAHLKDAPLIISVTEKFPEDGRKGGHLVVARGTSETADGGLDVLIRDPSAWGQHHDRVPLARLSASYSGRCITFAPMPARPGHCHLPTAALTAADQPDEGRPGDRAAGLRKQAAPSVFTASAQGTKSGGMPGPL